ncbi:DNA polymerase III/DNA elongation factor III, tau and gamma subunits [Sterolibacterium denitrificans]|uniref:DNA polymerase III subunit gamma/tau n=1 Tax=Sterolibacterium denitrificans TaxID=157592 RepID=A0A7Z7HRJ1_9PROT|nr:DNA polymerase III subunit gamma/tau [Sterolibacterium denitrificans]SMB27604.1 DNA polymerase III/DNA elongation factor III, tau and gamma subunits [Sterolibacterium denitrificans]
MSYQVLARKWRPRSFASLVGQEHVVRALTHALEQQRLHHAYLFTGTRGVGKTTIARIMAKALNCESGITATPCGSCSACVEIDSGRFVDLIEVDAATNTKVDEMRQLLENATYAPTRGRFKVYVIDEVHMLSNSAFNAMLKTLEEPPEHIKFILATTDPQKIPVTVLSRCLQFNLKQMPQSHIIGHLTRILEEEGVSCEPAALKHLAKAAAGSMRDALSLLDQAIAHGAGRVEEENVRDMLGTVGDDYLYEILDALAAGDVAALMNAAETMDARSLSFDSALQELATLFHRIALLQFAPQALSDESERQRLAPYATGETAFDAEFLQLAYQIVIHGRDDLALAPDEAAGFSMTLLRLFAFRPESPAALGGMTQGRPRLASAPAAAATANATAPASVRATEPPDAAAVSAPPRVPAPSPASSVAAVPPSSSTSSAPPVAARPEPGAAAVDWHGTCVSMSLGGMVRSLAQHCELVDVDEKKITLRLPPAHQFLLGKPSQDKLENELQRHFGRPLRLEIILADTATETPVERNRQIQRERQDRAVASIEQDAFVRDVVDMFDATIDETSIKPLF